MASTDPLLAYKKKRDFAFTPEPAGAVARKKSVLSFVIQKHAARSLHYDFRLELDGTLKSWAIPKGPSLDPTQKRLAVQVEDHPLSYAGFEGVIPPKQYGAGTVIVWDRGTWEPVGDPRAGYRAGKLKFQLHGEKLKGGWALVRMRSDADSRQQPWLLIKERDAEAKPASDFSVVDALPDSVLAASASRRAGKKKAAAAKPVLPKAPAKSARQTKARGTPREAVFHGLRTDKPATAITRESAADALDTAARARDGTPAPGKRKAADPTEIGGVRITHPDRIIDPSTGLTKLDLVNYYAQVAKRILPHLVRRPVSLLRAPAGIQHQLFFQKHGDTLKIPGLKELDPAFDPEHPPLLEIDSLKALLGAAQMNVVEFHTWNATTRSIEKPDRMTFDLDPAEGLAWPLMLEAAQLVHTFLDELGLQSFLKTSGGKGLHVVVPLTPRDNWDTVKDFSKQIVQHIATVAPARFVSKSGPRNRLGKVFIDYLRNGRGATTVAAFSARARPGMGVSMPCSWKELPSLTGGAQWTIVNAHERLEAGTDPWAGYAKTRQTLTAAMRKLGLGR